MINELLVIKAVIVTMVCTMIAGILSTFYLSRQVKRAHRLYLVRTDERATARVIDVHKLVNPSSDEVKERARIENKHLVPFTIHFPADEMRAEAYVEATAEVTPDSNLPHVWFPGMEKPVRWRDRLSKASKIAAREAADNS